MNDIIKFCSECGKANADCRLPELPCDILDIINCARVDEGSISLLSYLYKAQDSIVELRKDNNKLMAAQRVHLELEKFCKQLDDSANVMISAGIAIQMFKAANTIRMLMKLLEHKEC